MLLTEQDVRKLLARKTENKNLDYKEAMNWNSAPSAQKGAVVKDVLAMSNSHNGGCILFGVRDGDFEAVGLSENDFGSFDVTRFTDFLNRYADPPLECAIQKFVIDGKRIVAISIPEFPDVPIICKTDLNDPANRQILKRGATYVRTERAASEVLSSAVVMREMLDLAVVKRGDQFMKMVDRVIAGRSQGRVRVAPSEPEKTLSLQRSADITLEALSDIFDLREGARKGHSMRVTIFTIAIAQQMGIPRDRIFDIARGAFMHDLGKMGIPESILLKPGALTRDEVLLVEEHCVKGYQIVRRIPFLASSVAEIVYAHHERYDGKGYPRGLRKEEVVLGARILAVANTFDSITSDLPYRAASPFAVARAEIEHCSGTQFDPEIVSTFQAIPDRVFYDLRQEVSEKLGVGPRLIQ